MDVYSGYNQIQKHALDKEKIAFITKDVNFCYRVMQQIGRNVQVYVDDMVIKSHMA